MLSEVLSKQKPAPRAIGVDLCGGASLQLYKQEICNLQRLATPQALPHRSTQVKLELRAAFPAGEFGVRLGVLALQPAAVFLLHDPSLCRGLSTLFAAPAVPLLRVPAEPNPKPLGQNTPKANTPSRPSRQRASAEEIRGHPKQAELTAGCIPPIRAIEGHQGLGMETTAEEGPTHRCEYPTVFPPPPASSSSSSSWKVPFDAGTTNEDGGP